MYLEQRKTDESKRKNVATSEFEEHKITSIKSQRQVQRNSWSNGQPKFLACLGFLYKVVHKIGRLRKFNRARAREIEFNFLPLGLCS